MLVGANYHPGDVGCEYWRRFDPSSIAADFAAMDDAGLNAVRFFTFWRDFEPEAGRYNETVFNRLVTTVAMANERGLTPVISILTVWMNGQLFEPDWLRGRSLWTDPEMTDRAVDFAAEVAKRLQGYRVGYYDLGDELPLSRPDAATLGRVEVVRWWRRLVDGIRQHDSSTPILQCMDGSALAGENQFHPAWAEPLDAVGVHGFPLWNPYTVESNRSYKASHLAGFLAGMAGTWHEVVVDEVGCYATTESHRADHLRLTLPSVWYRGARAVFFWCWQDLTATQPPYELRPNERDLGLIDSAGDPKPALGVLGGFARWIDELDQMRPAPAATAILVDPGPEEPESYLSKGHTGTKAVGPFYAHLLCSRAHLAHDFTRLDRLDDYQLIILPTVTHVTLSMQDALERYVRAGGTVACSPGAVLDGFPGRRLSGVELEDFRLTEATSSVLSFDGINIPVDRPAGQRQRVRLREAVAVARFDDGEVALTERCLGRGRFFYWTFELEWLLNRPDLLESQPWERLYRAIADRCGVVSDWNGLSADVEVLELVDADDRASTLFLNHGSDSHVVSANGFTPGRSPLELAAKSIELASVRLDEVRLDEVRL